LSFQISNLELRCKVEVRALERESFLRFVMFKIMYVHNVFEYLAKMIPLSVGANLKLIRIIKVC
jgi:hypothetical protein